MRWHASSVVSALLLAWLGACTNSPASTDLATENPEGLSTSHFITRTGAQLQHNGQPFRFAGTNLYWVGLDDNLRDSSGRPTYPTPFRIDNGFSSAAKMKANVVRAHTLGISVGCPECLEPSLGHFNPAAFDSIDYAVSSAAKHNIRLVIPLTDQWRWYHGGKSTFTGWRGHPNRSGENAGTSQEQKASEAHFYTDPQVIADFKQYISYLLTHVNPLTGLALKDDPTILAWETGNEIWDAPPAWTQEIAAFIKHQVGAQQLVADGSAASGNHVTAAALDAADVDIVGGHFYPIDTPWMAQDAEDARKKNKVYFVGEFDWTAESGIFDGFLAEAERNPHIAGVLFWTLLPYQEDGTPEPHGDGFTSITLARTTSRAHAWSDSPASRSR